MTSHLKLICAAVALASAGPVLGATTWTLTNTPTTGVSIGAYANTNGTDNSTTTANNAASQTIESATWVKTYGGITNQDAPSTCDGRFTSGGSFRTDYCDAIEGTSPEHAIDNEQRYDMALLSFTSSVKLTDVVIGWPSSGYDTDITVLAYTGADPFATSGAGTKLTGLTYDQLIGKGWANVGNYSDLQQNVAKTDQRRRHFSSYWLIGAYNPLANPSGGSVTGGVASASNATAYDYIKLASVTGCVQGPGCGGGGGSGGSVPEPGTLALLGVALLGGYGLRRRARG